MGKTIQRGTESLADLISRGNGEEYIRNDFLLSTARGVGSAMRKASIAMNPRAAKQQLAITKAQASRDRLEQIEKSREEAMKPQGAGDILDQIIKGMEKSGVQKKLDKILELLEKSQKPGLKIPGAGGVIESLKRRGKNILKSGLRGLAKRALPIAAPLLATGAMAAGLSAVGKMSAFAPRGAIKDSSGNFRTGRSTTSVGSNKVKLEDPKGMNFSTPLAKYVAQEEGIKLKAYGDVGGKATIGVGHLITAEEIKQGFIDTGNGDKIMINRENILDTVGTKEQIKDLFEKRDLPEHEARAKKSLGEDAWKKLKDEQKASIISYVYNVGNADGLVERGLRDAILSGDTDKAAKIVANGVNTVNGVPHKALVNRRKREGELFKNGFAEDVKSGKESGAKAPEGQTATAKSSGAQDPAKQLDAKAPAGKGMSSAPASSMTPTKSSTQSQDISRPAAAPAKSTDAKAPAAKTPVAKKETEYGTTTTTGRPKNSNVGRSASKVVSQIETISKPTRTTKDAAPTVIVNKPDTAPAKPVGH